MKVIYPEKQTAVSVSLADANYAADNLLDDNLGKVWKSTGNTGIITVTIGSGSNAIALFGTNATTAVVTAKNNGGATVKTDTFTLIGTRTYKQCWLEYTQQDAIHSATIALTAGAGMEVEAGVVIAGAAVDLPNPRYGFAEGRKSYSIIKELNNGAIYSKVRNIVRTFQGDFIVSRSTEFYNFTDIYDNIGEAPLAMLLAEDDIDNQWAVFGRIITPWSGSHAHPNHSSLSVSILEAV